jgi:O-antigen/teichoic acid export membrane protein
LAFEIAGDSVHEHRGGGHAPQTARLPQRENSLDPAIAFLTQVGCNPLAVYMGKPKRIWMNEKFLILKNTFILAVTRCLIPILSVGLIAVITRVKGLEFRGEFAFIVTLSAMFAMVSQLGLQGLIVREAAKKKERASMFVSSAVPIGIFTSVLMMVVMFFAIQYFQHGQRVVLCFRLLSLTLILDFIDSVFEAIFIAFEKMVLIFVKQIITNLVRIIGSVTVVFLGYGLIHLVAILLLVGVLSTFLSYYLFNAYIQKFKFQINLKTMLYLIRHSPTFLFITIVSVLSWQVDLIMLDKITNSIQVGLYANAYRLFEATMILPQAYMRSCFPQLSRLFHSDNDSFRTMSSTMLRHLCVYLFVLVGIMFPLAALPVRIIFGPESLFSAKVLQILMFGLISWGIARVFSYFLVAAGKQKYDLIAGAIATAFNITLNLILIPQYKGLGAAIATVSSLSLFCVLEYCFVRKFVYDVPVIDIIAVPLGIGSLIMALTFIAKANAVMMWIVIFLLICAIAIIGCKLYGQIYRSVSTLGVVGENYSSVDVEESQECKK